MRQYLDLLHLVMSQGEVKRSRAVLATGYKPDTRSVFGHQLRVDLRLGFPLLTTKAMPFKSIALELFWFLNGSTDARWLQARNVKIWDQWADPITGDLGPIYGKQWRAWQCPDGGTIDQIARVLEGIRRVKVNPHDEAARRLVVTSWNPADVDKIRGPSGCHTLFQFSLSNTNRLSCHLYQRSADLFLGVPFNIASYALLTHLIAKICGLEVGDFIHSFGDAHIYENHFEQVSQQLTRTPRALPQLQLADQIHTLDDLQWEDLRLIGYDPHPRLTGEVAV